MIGLGLEWYLGLGYNSFYEYSALVQVEIFPNQKTNKKQTKTPKQIVMGIDLRPTILQLGSYTTELTHCVSTFCTVI